MADCSRWGSYRGGQSKLPLCGMLSQPSVVENVNAARTSRQHRGACASCRREPSGDTGSANNDASVVLQTLSWHWLNIRLFYLWPLNYFWKGGENKDNRKSTSELVDRIFNKLIDGKCNTCMIECVSAAMRWRCFSYSVSCVTAVDIMTQNCWKKHQVLFPDHPANWKEIVATHWCSSCANMFLLINNLMVKQCVLCYYLVSLPFELAQFKIEIETRIWG